MFVLAPQRRGGTTLVEMAGGALCSLRCAALAAVVCPHYSQAGVAIGVYRVPRHSRVDLDGCGYSNDDEYDLATDTSIRVLAASSPAPP